MDHDFYYFLLNKDIAPDDLSVEQLAKYEKEWFKSKKRGRFESIYRRKRRQEFGPGRFHASSSSGVYLE